MKDDCDEEYIDGGCDDEAFVFVYADGAYTECVEGGTVCSGGGAADGGCSSCGC